MRPACAVPLAGLALALGCTSPAFERLLPRSRRSAPAPAEPPAPGAAIDPAILERAQNQRRQYLEREVARLRADLQQAEELDRPARIGAARAAHARGCRIAVARRASRSTA
jgi:hypothetical protein